MLAVLPRAWPASIREAVAWDLSAAIYLILAFRVMLTCKGDVLRARAARQDDSRLVILATTPAPSCQAGEGLSLRGVGPAQLGSLAMAQTRGGV